MNGSNGSANGFGSATKSVKNPRPEEEAEVVTTTVDATTGTIVVDKTTKKMGMTPWTRLVPRVELGLSYLGYNV